MQSCKKKKKSQDITVHLTTPILNKGTAPFGQVFFFRIDKVLSSLTWGRQVGIGVKWFGFSDLMYLSLNHIDTKILSTDKMLILSSFLKSQRFSSPLRLQMLNLWTLASLRFLGPLGNNSYHFWWQQFWGRKTDIIHWMLSPRSFT